MTTEQETYQAEEALGSNLLNLIELDRDENGTVEKIRIVSNAEPAKSWTMAEYVLGGGDRLQGQYIAFINWFHTYNIALFSPTAPSSKIYTSKGIFLEHLPHASQSECESHLVNWKIVAVLCGLKLRTEDAEIENRSVLALAKSEIHRLDEIVPMLARWPEKIYPIDKSLFEPVMDLLNAYRIYCEAKLSVKALIKDSVTMETAEPRSLIDVCGTGIRLSKNLDMQMNLGMKSVAFNLKLHEKRKKAPWAVLMSVSTETNSKGTYDVMITSQSNKTVMRKSNCFVARVGRADESKNSSALEVNLWKAAATCFGMVVANNSNQMTFNFSQEKIQKVIQENYKQVCKIIQSWPVNGHQILIPYALARAQLMLNQAQSTTSIEAKEPVAMLASAIEEITAAPESSNAANSVVAAVPTVTPTHQEPEKVKEPVTEAISVIATPEPTAVVLEPTAASPETTAVAPDAVIETDSINDLVNQATELINKSKEMLAIEIKRTELELDDINAKMAALAKIRDEKTSQLNKNITKLVTIQKTLETLSGETA